MPAMRKLRWAIGVALLLFQVGAIVYARFVPARYFCWAPFDMQTDYRLDVHVNGRRLSPAEIQKRYRRPAKGTDNRSSRHLMDIVEQAEHRYHPHDRTEVIMSYRVNGKQEQEWRYHQP
jgi:hypothetical protein